MKQYVCTICGYVYDEGAGVRWEELPEDWTCPLCGAAKSDFVEQGQHQPAGNSLSNPAAHEEEAELRQLTTGELAALCSNLARGCEKQYLAEEAALFGELADYFTAKIPKVEGADAGHLLALAKQDLEELLPGANAAAGNQPDRGALRALVWSEKVSRMLHSLLARYEKDGGGFLENTGVFVCTICGFVYLGDGAPALCPVCKVPDWKFQQVERRRAL